MRAGLPEPKAFLNRCRNERDEASKQAMADGDVPVATINAAPSAKRCALRRVARGRCPKPHPSRQLATGGCAPAALRLQCCHCWPPSIAHRPCPPLPTLPTPACPPSPAPSPLRSLNSLKDDAASTVSSEDLSEEAFEAAEEQEGTLSRFHGHAQSKVGWRQRQRWQRVWCSRRQAGWAGHHSAALLAFPALPSHTGALLIPPLFHPAPP